MTTEQRTRFADWWTQYIATAMQVSNDGIHFSLADRNEEIAWKAWQEAERQADDERAERKS